MNLISLRISCFVQNIAIFFEKKWASKNNIPFKKAGIMSTDIIPAPNVVSAHQRRKAAYTMGACGHGIKDFKRGERIEYYLFKCKM